MEDMLTKEEQELLSTMERRFKEIFHRRHAEKAEREMALIFNQSSSSGSAFADIIKKD